MSRRRVNYSEPLWGALEAAVQHKEQISGVDFAGESGLSWFCGASQGVL